jgi:DnaA family protein
MKQLLLDIEAPPKPSIENFVVGSNAEALNSLQMAMNGNAQNRFIYLWGETGSGKTHLLASFQQIARGQNMQFVDDVQTLTDEQQIALFNTYNQLRENGGTLITAGIAAPTQMGLRDDLATRLAWGLTYQLHPLSHEEKAKALKNYANALNMKLPDEVIEYCLRYLRRDLQSLISTISALDLWSRTNKRAVTIPLLKQLLQLPSA